MHKSETAGSVDDMLVHLICYHKGIILDGKGGNGLQLVPAEHLAAGVGGVAQDQCLGSLGKALFDQGDIKLIGRRHQRDIVRGWSFGPAPRGSSVHQRSQRTGVGRHRLSLPTHPAAASAGQNPGSPETG